jgi:8-oxo-dGTP pyrophosphatase MutT (NUDIX family)
LMVRNFSGRLGFPGGNVDEKNVDNIDVLKETALREAKEEIGFDVLKGQSVDLLCSHYVEGQKGASATHLFTVEVRSFSDIIKIQAQSHRGCDFGSEIVSVEQIRPDRQMKDPDFKSIFNAQLAKTCAEEMIELWHHVDFVDQDEIERIRRMHVPIYKKS